MALKKLDGVETVEVSLEKSSAVITLKADNKLTLPHLRSVVRKTGYPTKDAQITARGRVVVSGTQVTLDLLNGSSLQVVAPPKDTGSGVIEVTGISRLSDKNEEQLAISKHTPFKAEAPNSDQKKR